jgi:hypothetical protein
MEKKKQHVGAVAVICGFAFLALGSGTMEGAGNSGTGTWIFDWEKDHKSIGQYDVIYQDNPQSMPQAVENADLFGRANWFLAILNTFELQDKLSIDQKLTLFDALFNYVPAETQTVAYRIVSLGGFKDDRTLQLVLGAVKLNEKAPQGTHGMNIISNCMIIDTSKGRIFTVNELYPGRTNWDTLGIVFPDGRVIRGNSLYSEKELEERKEESGDNEALLAINLSDLYIKDELKENDAEAFAMLEKAMAVPSDVPGSDIILRLNYFLCLLSVNRVDEAETMLTEATDLFKKIEEPEAGLAEAVELEAPTLLAIYRKAGL